MVFIIVAMLVCLVVSAVVVLFVAYPHRGEEIPRAGWLTGVLASARHRAPTLSEWESDLLHAQRGEDLAESGNTTRS